MLRKEILNNPRQAVIDMTVRFNATCLLKGPGTGQQEPLGQAICAHGNPHGQLAWATSWPVWWAA